MGDGSSALSFFPTTTRSRTTKRSKRVCQIVRKMPAGGHLDCIWCAKPGRTGIDAIAIAADDLHAGMFTKPADQGIGRLFEQVDDVRGGNIEVSAVQSCPSAPGKQK
jgi:hypothetical protein